MVTGGGGLGAAAFLRFFGFLPFSTLDEPLPLDSAFPEESVGDLDLVVLVVGFDLVIVVVVGVVEEVDVEEVGLGLGFDGVVADVEVEVEVEVEVVCGCVFVVTVAAGVVPVTGAHEVATLVIALFGGSGSELAGVPGATFWKTRV